MCTQIVNINISHTRDIRHYTQTDGHITHRETLETTHVQMNILHTDTKQCRQVNLNITIVTSQYLQWLDMVSAPQPRSSIIRASRKIEP